MPLNPGDMLASHYRIEAEIGRGAYGRVYRARDTNLDRLVAIKELSRGADEIGSSQFSDYVRRFQREARVQAGLNHPNIVQVYELIQEGADQLYLAMEFVDRESLRDYLAKHGPLPMDEIVHITADILTGLAAVHADPRDIVHRDIKPSNVLLTKTGRAKLADFGLAQVGDESLRSGAGQPHPGTPAYMSPEQETTSAYLYPASDLFSVGCVLFEMLTGVTYKGGAKKERKELAELRPDTPKWLVELTKRALAKEADDRPVSAAEMGRLLATRNSMQKKGIAPRLLLPLMIGGIVIMTLILTIWRPWMNPARPEPTAFPIPTQTATVSSLVTPSPSTTRASVPLAPSAQTSAPSAPTMSGTSQPTAVTTATATSPATTTPMAIPTAAPQADANVVIANLNLRAGPGTAYRIIQTLSAGDPLKVDGQLADKSWLKVRTVDGDEGWVSASPDLIKINVMAQNIPIATPPPLPTPKPATAAASAPAANEVWGLRFAPPPQIDGDTREWPKTGVVRLDNQTTSHREGSDWNPPPSDLTVEIRVGWDATNLYIAADIVDNKLVGDDSTRMWGDDDLEISVTTAGHPRQFAFVVDGRYKHLVDGWQEVPPNLRYARKTWDGGWSLEVAIPIGTLEMTNLQAGQNFPFNFAYWDDDDRGMGDTHFVRWGDNTTKWDQFWGKLTLRNPEK